MRMQEIVSRDILIEPPRQSPGGLVAPFHLPWKEIDRNALDLGGHLILYLDILVLVRVGGGYFCIDSRFAQRATHVDHDLRWSAIRHGNGWDHVQYSHALAG